MTEPTSLPRRTPAEQVRRAMLAEGAVHGLAGSLPLEWIGHSGASVAAALRDWANGKLAEIPAGDAFDVVVLPHKPGWEAVFQLRAMGVDPGPILHACNEVAYFVTTGSAADWQLARARLVPAGEMIHVPHPCMVAPHTQRGHTWIVPPKGDGRLTDGADLYGAYVAAAASLGEQVEAVS